MAPGLIWEKQKDNIIFSFKKLVALIYPCPTKRQLLSFIASIYDHLGLINPFVLRLKVLFQIVCREASGWNDMLSEERLKEWCLISNDAKQAHDAEIVVGIVILKVLLKLSYMVSQTLVYQVTVAANISDIVTIIIATPYLLSFLQNINCSPFEIASYFIIS